MKFSKEYIVEKAFEVFMSRGYENTSISDLQKKLGMSRGTLYTYFKGKNELFVAVVDRYVVGSLLDAFEMPISQDILLPEYINICHNRMKKLIGYFDELKYDSRFLNYTAMIIQAAKYYPGFVGKLKSHKRAARYDWERAIKNSIAKGDVRKDVNTGIIAGIFAANVINIEMSEISGAELTKSLNEWKKTVLYIYDLIKK